LLRIFDLSSELKLSQSVVVIAYAGDRELDYASKRASGRMQNYAAAGSRVLQQKIAARERSFWTFKIQDPRGTG
jgi:hypothetical protein